MKDYDLNSWVLNTNVWGIKILNSNLEFEFKSLCLLMIYVSSFDHVNSLVAQIR